MADKELTEAQLAQQDFVDDEIMRLLCRLANKEEGELEWDMEHIGDIRDVVQEIICNRLKIMSPYDFYPWIKTCGNCDHFDGIDCSGGICDIDGGVAAVQADDDCERWKDDKDAWTQTPQAKEPEPEGTGWGPCACGCGHILRNGDRIRQVRQDAGIINEEQAMVDWKYDTGDDYYLADHFDRILKRNKK